MKKVVRLLAMLIVLLAASAVPSPAIIPNCSEFCDCESNCDWAAGTRPPPLARTAATGAPALTSVVSPPSAATSKAGYREAKKGGKAKAP